MSEFTKVGDIKADVPLEPGEWQGLRIGQTWCRRTHVKKVFPLGRVAITDLVKRNGNPVVKFEDTGAVRLELSLGGFLKEFVRQ